MAGTEDKLIRYARAFLASGRPAPVDEPALAEACNALIRQTTQHEVTSAVALGRKFVARTKSSRGPLGKMAYRSLGWALLVSGDYSKAEKAYLRARQLNVREPIIRARIDRILIDIYMYLGNNREGRRRARMALATFTRQRAHADVAKTRVNYGNLLHRQDRHREARRLYVQAGR